MLGARWVAALLSAEERLVDLEASTVEQPADPRASPPGADPESLREDSESLREDSESLREDSESLREDSESLREDSESPREDSESPCEDSESLREDSESLREDSESPREDSESLHEDSESLREDSESLREDSESLCKCPAGEGQPFRTTAMGTLASPSLATRVCLCLPGLGRRQLPGITEIVTSQAPTMSRLGPDRAPLHAGDCAFDTLDAFVQAVRDVVRRTIEQLDAVVEMLAGLAAPTPPPANASQPRRPPSARPRWPSSSCSWPACRRASSPPRSRPAHRRTRSSRRARYRRDAGRT